MGKLVQVEYGACELMKPDVEGSVWVLQAGFLDSCALQLSPKTQAAPMLPRDATAYEGLTLQPTMVRRRDGELVCRVPGCGKTVPLGRMHICIAFQLRSQTLLPPCSGFCGDSGRVLRTRPVKGGGGIGTAHFLRKWVFFVSSACGQHTSRVCRPCPSPGVRLAVVAQHAPPL